MKQNKNTSVKTLIHPAGPQNAANLKQNSTPIAGFQKPCDVFPTSAMVAAAGLEV